MAECKRCRTTWLDVDPPGPCPSCELDRIVAKLPKTADGVPVVPGDHIWIPADTRLYGSDKTFPEGLCQWLVVSVQGSLVEGFMGSRLAKVFAHRCYSTSKAVEAAVKGKDDA